MGPRCAVLVVLVRPSLVGSSWGGFAAFDAAATGSSHSVRPPDMGVGATFSPVVQHTGQPPTGYSVTFRYRDPQATIVQIEGDWAFSSPSSTTMLASEGRPPSQWQPGDVAINPDQLADFESGVKLTWPIVDMTKDPATGDWTYTTPLPSGVFDYEFIVNCTHPELTPAQLADPNLPAGYLGCPEIADPSNPPWNSQHRTTHGFRSHRPARCTCRPIRSTRSTTPGRRRPRRADRSPTSPTPAADGPPSLPGKNYLAVYTPPGYDPHRRTPYPTLYLSHGYDNNEIDWSTDGDAANILDNLIDKHQIEPMVVVMPNAYWQAPPNPTKSARLPLEQNLARRDSVCRVALPRVEGASERAFAGLSFGGVLAMTCWSTTQ